MASGDDLAIRSPGLDDLDALVALWRDLVRDQQPYGTWIRADGNDANARAWLSTRMTFDGVRVAAVDDELVGFVTYELMRDQFDRAGQDGIVHNLYVRWEYRRRGIGSALLARAEDLLEDRGVDRIRLELLTANEGASTFYRERGYEPYRATFRKVVDSPVDAAGDG